MTENTIAQVDEGRESCLYFVRNIEKQYYTVMFSYMTVKSGKKSLRMKRRIEVK